MVESKQTIRGQSVHERAHSFAAKTAMRVWHPLTSCAGRVDRHVCAGARGTETCRWATAAL